MADTDKNINIEESAVADEKPRSYHSLIALIICFLISGLMWLFVELLKPYNDEIKYNVEFKNIPKGLMLTNSGDSSIFVGINAQGFELMDIKYIQRNKKPLVVDLEDINIRQTSNAYVASLSTSKLIRNLNQQLSYSKSIAYIRPDTLYFKFSEVFSKQVPVVPVFSFDLGSQYEVGDSLLVTPKIITVRSIKTVIDTIKAAYTEAVKIKATDTGMLLKVRLDKGANRALLRYSLDSVNVKFNLYRITEAIYTVPVQIKPENKENLKIIPEKVDVYCRVPMELFRSIKAEDFKVTTDYKKGMSNGKLNVKVVGFPKGARVIKTKPSEIEYIILSK